MKGFHFTFPISLYIVVEQKGKVFPDVFDLINHHPRQQSTRKNTIGSIFIWKIKSLIFSFFSFWYILFLTQSTFQQSALLYVCVDRGSILSLAPYWRTPGGGEAGTTKYLRNFFWELFFFSFLLGHYDWHFCLWLPFHIGVYQGWYLVYNYFGLFFNANLFVEFWENERVSSWWFPAMLVWANICKKYLQPNLCIRLYH